MIGSVAGKTLREYFREPALLSFILAGPTLLVVLFYMVYAPVKDRMGDFVRVTVVNEDRGPRGAELLSALVDLSFEGQPAVGITFVADLEEAETALEEGKTSLVLRIPPDFSAMLDSAAQGHAPSDSTNLLLEGDTSSFNYQFTKAFVDDTLRGFIRSHSGQGDPTPARFTLLPGTGTSADFDYSVPGLLIFAVSMLIVSTAIPMVRENVSGTLLRIRLARMSAVRYLSGIGLAQCALAAGMVVLGLGTAIALGYGRGSGLLAPERIFWLLLVSQVFALVCIALGILTAAFSRTDGEAATLGSIIMVPLIFLSGILFPMPAMPLFTMGGVAFGAYDLIPATLASEVISHAVADGAPFFHWFPQLVALCMESGLLLWIAFWIFYRRRLMRDA
jgi:ABC-2 type transport system permease protein